VTRHCHDSEANTAATDDNVEAPVCPAIVAAKRVGRRGAQVHASPGTHVSEDGFEITREVTQVGERDGHRGIPDVRPHEGIPLPLLLLPVGSRPDVHSAQPAALGRNEAQVHRARKLGRFLSGHALC